MQLYWKPSKAYKTRFFVIQIEQIQSQWRLWKFWSSPLWWSSIVRLSVGKSSRAKQVCIVAPEPQLQCSTRCTQAATISQSAQTRGRLHIASLQSELGRLKNNSCFGVTMITRSVLNNHYYEMWNFAEHNYNPEIQNRGWLISSAWLTRM